MDSSTTPGARRRECDTLPGADVTQAYRLWDELFALGLRVALSTSGEEPEERKKAWDRLIRGHERSLAERDEVLVRLASLWKADPHGE